MSKEKQFQSTFKPVKNEKNEVITYKLGENDKIIEPWSCACQGNGKIATFSTSEYVKHIKDHSNKNTYSKNKVHFPISIENIPQLYSKDKITIFKCANQECK